MTDETKAVSNPDNRKDLFKYTSVRRISKIPVVESGYNYVSYIYTKVKNSNGLVRWSLGNVEGGIQLAVDKTMPTVLLLDLPLTMVDTIICKGLDTVSVAIPAINYPPDKLVNMGKDYVNSNLISPVLKRADSVKQLGLSEASRVGEIAASRLDNALNIADKYVDRYLPDSTDTTDGKKENEQDESKTTQAIHHMNRLGKKLQRRLTKRTLMEAEALKKGSQDIAQALIYLADLLLRDPKGFADKMKEVWNNLSEDEPENQVPPANIEQLVALLARESARKTVHLINFVVSTLPAQSAHAFRYTIHHLQYYANYFLKVVHLEGARGIAFATSAERLKQLRSLVLHLLEILGSKIKDTKGSIATTPMRAIPSADTNSNESTPNKLTNSESETSPKSESDETNNHQKSRKNKNKNKKEISPKIEQNGTSLPATPPPNSNQPSNESPISTSSTTYFSPTQNP